MDAAVAYEGYTTRFFRDSHRNAFQIYLNTLDARVVHVWADASNASASFTVRDASGEPASLAWGSAGAVAYSDGPRRVVRHRLASDANALQIGWFVLGTMRQERDFQYWEWHRRPFGGSRFVLDEFAELANSLERLPAGERERHLSLLDAGNLAELRSRLEPRFTLTEDDTEWVVLVEHRSLDGRNRMTLELRGDLSASTASISDNVIALRAHDSDGVRFDVLATTDAVSLTPLDRGEIFNDDFEAFYAREQSVSDSLRAVLTPSAYDRDARVIAFRGLERAIRGLELLSYEEKIMAALPNYATYFGRDMMMAALMLESIVSVDVQEYVIANVLRKLASSGDVSHEEALGEQAIRENAAEYSALVLAWEEDASTNAAAASEQLDHARELLGNLQAVRENRRMIDDDFQLPVLVDRYLDRSDVSAARKRRFLAETLPSGFTRLDALLRNLALVTARAHSYVEQPTVSNLVGFLFRDDDGWFPGSWRDSRVGYGNARFAMDVNVVWVPNALEACARILQNLEALGLSALEAITRQQMDAASLVAYLRDPATLDNAIATWRGARRYFAVRLEPEEIHEHVNASLDELPDNERVYWQRRLRVEDATERPLSFLALSLDDSAQQIPAANTDLATDLFLEDYTENILRGNIDPETVTRMLDVFVRAYPVGLLVDGLGLVVVNDMYAGPDVKQRFRDDLYHSPRVVWGREVNLLFLGLAKQIEAAYDSSGRLRSESAAFRSYMETLRGALDVTRHAVEASGMRHNELWSYRIDGDTLRPVRYGTSSDIQLWNLTDLAVRFELDRLQTQ